MIKVFQQLATATSVTTEELLVPVNGRFPYALIEALQAQAQPSATEEGTDALPEGDEAQAK